MNERLLPHINLSEGWILRLALLIGQSVFLGITLSQLVITANSLFLIDFGPQALPYVYITVALIGSSLVYGLAALQRRWSLPQLAMSSVALLAVFYLLSWLGITLAQMRWLSFALVVSFSLVIQIGFVFLGGQAGRLLDVRQIKRLFPQVVAGFVVGFILGALGVPLLIQVAGSTEQALVGLVASSLLWLSFIYLTDRRYGSLLRKVESGRRTQPAQSLRQLLNKRYVLLIFVYLMLATMVSQFSDFLVMSQASARYTNTTALAQFFSGFTAVLNITDLLFTILIAGFLLSRFGLRTGLLANAALMVVFFLAMAVVGSTLGLGSSLFFMLVVIARIANLSLTDGMTRASTNAAYQALPVQERILVQTGVEGIGAPLALGIVGVLLLGYNFIPGLSLIHVVFLTLILAAAWLLAALAVYGGYKVSLGEVIRRQPPAAADLYLDDPATQAAIDNLLNSGKAHEARLALDVLEHADHPSLALRLVELLDHPQASIQAEALARIEQRQVQAARPQVEALLSQDEPLVVTAAAMRTISALNSGDADERVIAGLQDERPEIRLAALVGLLRYGGIPGILAAGRSLTVLQDSGDCQQRLFLAQVIGQVKSPSLYHPLEALLKDEDLEVRRAALLAAGEITHPALLTAVAAGLNNPQTRSAAASALTSYGPAILPLVQQAVQASTRERHEQALRLLRICGQVGGFEVQAFLCSQIQHRVHVVRHQVLSALNCSGYQAEEDDLPAIQSAFQHETDHALHILITRRDLGEKAGLEPLLRALDGELSHVRQRMFLLLSFQYERHSILRAAEHLASNNESQYALALEVLDVSLSPAQKGVLLPLVNPSLSLDQRIQRLSRQTQAPKGREAHLQDLIADADDIWQANWLRACAVYAAGMLPADSCQGTISEVLSSRSDPIIRETAVWALERLLAPSMRTARTA